MATMAASSFQVFAVAVLAADLIDEFEISRGRIGLLISANTITGAALAPWLGRVTDRVGGRRSVLMLLTVVVIGLTTMVLARSYTMLVIASMISGAPQGWCNPATNKLIVERLDEGNRGVVLGIKQSGVQLSVFLAGITLPLASQTIGWRSGISAYALVTFCLLALTAVTLPTVSTSPGQAIAATPQREPKRPIDRLVFTIAAYAALMGVVGGGATRFIPLFAHEELRYSTTVAGLAASLTGLLAIGTRIWWSRLAEKRSNTLTPLTLMAAGGSIVALMLAVSTTLGPWLLWPIAVVGAITISAWNSVAMLRVVNEVNPDWAGSATGIVQLGFLGGIALGAPAVGWSVDLWGTYTPAWLALMVVAGLAAAVISRSSRQNLPSGSR